MGWNIVSEWECVESTYLARGASLNSGSVSSESGMAMAL
jgi:hypothetical protein